MSAHRAAIRSPIPPLLKRETGSTGPRRGSVGGDAGDAVASNEGGEDVALIASDCTPSCAHILSARLCNAIAATLQKLSDDVEQLGTELSGDPDVGARHLASLQSVDRVAQHLAGLSHVIAATDVNAAISDITLEDLRDCLLAAASASPDNSDNGDDDV